MLFLFCLKLKRPYLGVLISIGIFKLWRVLYYDLRIFFFVIPVVKAIFRKDIRVSTILFGCCLAILYQSDLFRYNLKKMPAWHFYLLSLFVAIATRGIHYLWIILMVSLIPFVFYPMMNPSSLAGGVWKYTG